MMKNILSVLPLAWMASAAEYFQSYTPDELERMDAEGTPISMNLGDYMHLVLETDQGQPLWTAEVDYSFHSFELNANDDG